MEKAVFIVSLLALGGCGSPEIVDNTHNPIRTRPPTAQPAAKTRLDDARETVKELQQMLDERYGTIRQVPPISEE